MQRYTIKKLFTNKKTMILLISGALIVAPIQSLLPASVTGLSDRAYAAAAQQPKLTGNGESIISSGVIRKDYTFTTTRGSKQIATGVHVLGGDLSNPVVS